MHSRERLSPLARALRILSGAGFCIFVISIVLISCTRELNRHHKRKRDALSISRIAITETARLHGLRRTLKSSSMARRNYEDDDRYVDVERTNLTVVLEHVEINTGNASEHWMYTHGKFPFVQSRNKSSDVHANTKFTWNDDGKGNGSCLSDGSGKVSRGYLDPFNYFLGLKSPPDFPNVSVELRNLTLSDFMHINTVRPGGSWNIMGEAGDTRRYNHGTLRIASGTAVLLSTRNLQWIQNLSYPNPVGEAQRGSLAVSAYFVAEIQELKSNKEWVHRLDPNRVGFILGIITAASFGPESCFSSNSYWISLRGFPDFSQEGSDSTAVGFIAGGRNVGTKVGTYQGSSPHAIATARTLSNVAKGVVLTIVSGLVGTAVASATIAVVAPGATPGPPGQGLVRLIGTVAFVAKVNEIQGFHSDAMSEFSGGLGMFIGKIDWPWPEKANSAENTTRILHRLGGLGHENDEHPSSHLLEKTIRQEEEQTVSISEELFGNCAFYTTLIVVGFLILHVCIWIATRKRPLSEQLGPHAWMIYLFSIIMSHVYRAAVLSSMQYMRSHVGAGTGKAGLYIVAVLQLLIIGVGFTVFFVTVMVLALRRVRKKDVEWVPKEDIADPETRRSPLIMGEYKASDGNAFHSLFECYYSSLAGPRLWLAVLELTIVFLDAICTAVIWNEVICLAILVCVYALLFALFLLLTPFVDKIEGWLVVTLALVELVLLIMDFLAALGDYDMAESLEFGALILGFVAIALAVLIAIYCDLIPIVTSMWSSVTRCCRGELVAHGAQDTNGDSELGSEWSSLSRSATENDGSSGSKVMSPEGRQDEVESDISALLTADLRGEELAEEQLANTVERTNSEVDESGFDIENAKPKGQGEFHCKDQRNQGQFPGKLEVIEQGLEYDAAGFSSEWRRNLLGGEQKLTEGPQGLTDCDSEVEIFEVDVSDFDSGQQKVPKRVGGEEKQGPQGRWRGQSDQG